MFQFSGSILCMVNGMTVMMRDNYDVDGGILDFQLTMSYQARDSNTVSLTSTTPCRQRPPTVLVEFQVPINFGEQRRVVVLFLL